MADLVRALISKYPLISEQVSVAQVETILHELTQVITAKTAGAVVEFGCYSGTTSLFIRRLLDQLKEAREFHVYDSFAGLPAKTQEDNSGAGEQFVAGELAFSKKQFAREFQKAGLKLPKIHKSWFGELQDADVPDRIAFAFLDGDFYASIRDSLRLVVPRMQPGGVIVVDDYTREALPGAARAVHEYYASDIAQTVHNMAIIRL